MTPTHHPDAPIPATSVVMTTPRSPGTRTPLPRSTSDWRGLASAGQWGARYARWEDGLRALARALRGLEQAGLITRHTTRRAGHPPLHGVTLTKNGHAVLEALCDRSAGGDR